MDALSAYAPDAARTLGQVERAAWGAARSAGLGDLVELVSRVCAAQIGLAPLRPGPSYPATRWGQAGAAPWRSIEALSPRDVCGLHFAEQFTADVASITPELRTELFAEFGARAADFVAVVFVVDFLPRTWAGLDALVGGIGGGRKALPDSEPPGIWEALDEFTRMVPALDALDPVLTELVRLRGASQHRCRLCA